MLSSVVGNVFFIEPTFSAESDGQPENVEDSNVFNFPGSRRRHAA